MAYTPVDGSNIIANFVTTGTYVPVNGGNIIASFTGEIPPQPIYHRALLMDNGHIRQIPDSETGTGRKPLVLSSGSLKIQNTDEGLPVILANGRFRTLASSETLLI